MDLEIITLSEISQTEKNKYHITCMWDLKIWYKWTCLQNRNRLTDIEKENLQLPEGIVVGAGVGKDKLEVLD